MKNLKVGKKMFVSFGAIVLLMLVILAVTISTSVIQNSQLNRMDILSKTRDEAVHMADEVNQSRVPLRTVFTTISYSSEYDEAVELLNESNARLDTLETMVSQLGADESTQFKETITALRGYFSGVFDGIAKVHDNDVTLVERIGVMQAAGTEMISQSEELIEIVKSLISDGAGDVERTQDGIDNALTRCINLNQSINALNSKAAQLSLLQNIEVVPEITELADDVERQLEELDTVLTTAQAQQAMDEVAGAVATYRTEAGAVRDLVTSSNENTAAARSNLDLLLATVEDANTGIADQVGAALSENISSSTVSTILQIAIVVAATIFAVIIAIYLSNSIRRPLKLMETTMQQVGVSGNLNFTDSFIKEFKEAAQAKDEIGITISACDSLMARLIYVGERLTEVSRGDLRAEIELLSPEDTMGTALLQMNEGLNEMFAEINSIAGQVSAAASEIAIGAQSLAQGSTEQASTIEEISASVQSVNGLMAVAGETVQSSVALSLEISAVAEDGNKKMDDLSGSMQDINDASQNIGNVIKVIDDIAFQTNILALNAAVEAARAGEHGKGFAVVADEVRNLAGKSADAAKETAVLISANIEKTEQGMVFTTETAESLGKIIEGVGKTTDGLHEIARQAQEVTGAIGQVGDASEQVSHVVQQNSATSEESAAASEEMSSQAQVLQQLISRFKLKNSNVTPALPPSDYTGYAEDPSAFSQADGNNDIIF